LAKEPDQPNCNELELKDTIRKSNILLAIFYSKKILFLEEQGK
jgi:hypothetical protein